MWSTDIQSGSQRGFAKCFSFDDLRTFCKIFFGTKIEYKPHFQKLWLTDGQSVLQKSFMKRIEKIL